MNKQKNIIKQQGLTLVETLVALSIFGLVTASLMQLLPMNLSNARFSRNKTIASFLAQAKMEELISTNYTSILTGTSTEATLSNLHSDFSKFSRITNVRLVDGNLNDTVTDVGLKKINVTVQWKDLGTTKSLTINTLLSQL
jgi:type II secretion system protein I